MLLIAIHRNMLINVNFTRYRRFLHCHLWLLETNSHSLMLKAYSVTDSIGDFFTAIDRKALKLYQTPTPS